MRNKGKEVKTILKHMAIRDYELFKFFHTWQHAKHEGGFEGRKGKRPHRVRGSPLPQDAHHSFSMLSTMLKHGGGIAALHYEHRK
jgi:hypothetical protein